MRISGSLYSVIGGIRKGTWAISYNHEQEEAILKMKKMVCHFYRDRELTQKETIMSNKGMISIEFLEIIGYIN